MAITRTTPEARKAQAEALHASITEQIEALVESDQWMRFLDFAQSFHQYRTGDVPMFQLSE